MVHIRDVFNKLLKDFKDENLPLYRNFIQTIKNWKEEIINSFDQPFDKHKQTNVLAEYYNGRVKEVIDSANGLINFIRTRTRLLYMFNKDKGDKHGKYNK